MVTTHTITTTANLAPFFLPFKMFNDDLLSNSTI